MPKPELQLNTVTFSDSIILFEFLSHQIKLNKQWLWKANEEYPVHSREGEFVFTPTYDIVRRERTNPQKPGIPFDIKANFRFAKGSFAALYNIVSLVVHETNIEVKLKKKRVIKRLPLDSHNYTQEDLAYESTMMTRVGFFHNKKPTIIPASSWWDQPEAYVTMRKIPGRELVQVMQFELDREPKLIPIKARLQMTLALLYALKRDFTDKKIIHNDFHNANILLHYEKGAFSAKAIDVAQSQLMRSEENYTIEGNAIDYTETTALLDLVKLGRHLEAIWWDKPAKAFNPLGVKRLNKMIEGLKKLEETPRKPSITLQDLITFFEAFHRASLREYAQTIDLKELETWINSPPIETSQDLPHIDYISIGSTIGFYRPANEEQPLKKAKNSSSDACLELKVN